MYTNIDHSISSERLLEEEQFDHSNDKLVPKLANRHRPVLRRNAGLVLQIVLFIASATMLLISFSRYQQRAKVPEGQCQDFMPQWSPALEAVEHTGQKKRFDGSFATPNAFKGTPSPKIDASWDEITYATGGVISISEESLRAVNASLEYSVKLSPEIGGGYMASVEVLHQLHCLNMLRQATYEDYYRDKAEPWTDSPQTLRYHLGKLAIICYSDLDNLSNSCITDHCIDNLRQKLMCDADAGILTYVWVKGHPMPFPDFNVQHRCRDFRMLKQWIEARQVFTKGEYGVLRQPGTKELESPP